jgi:hypothetical protein
MLISHIQFSRLSQLERFIALDLPPVVGDLELLHDIENLLESLHHVYVFPGLDDSVNEFIGNEFGRHEYLPTRVSRRLLNTYGEIGSGYLSMSMYDGNRSPASYTKTKMVLSAV